MEVHTQQIEGIKFSVQPRGHRIICDQPMESGGTDAGMTPPELLLASLGACASYYAVEYLRTRKLANGGVSVSVTAEKLKGPARIGSFHVRLDSPVHLTPEQRQGLMHSIEHCLVKNTLLNPAQIEVSIDVSPMLQQASE